MRIAYNGRFLTKNEPGGAMKVSQRVFEYLLRRDEKNDYYLLTPPLNGVPDLSSAENVEIVQAPGKFFLKNNRPFGALWEQCVVPYLLLKIKPDLYHTSMSGTMFTGKVPAVVTVHDLGYENRDWFSGSFSTWYRFVVPRVIGGADKIIAVSEFTREEILRKFDVSEGKVEVVYNGVDQLFLNCGAGEEFDGELDLPEKYLAFVGSLNPRKNLTGVVEAYKKAREEYSLPHELLIAGAKKDIFTNTSEDLPEGVGFMDYLTENQLKEFYQKAEMTLLPSFYEGFGLPPLESMACGTPAIVSDRTALPEVVGDAAIKVDPEDVEEIADRIYELSSDNALRDELIAKGFERSQEFTWDKSAEETLQIYEEVTSGAAK